MQRALPRGLSTRFSASPCCPRNDPCDGCSGRAELIRTWDATMSLSLFDETAGIFAAGTDEQLAQNRYIRGERFAEAVLAVTPPSGYVLDYGCGPGRLARLIGQQGFRVHGVGPSRGMIEGARKLVVKGARVAFEAGGGSWDDR